MTSEFERVPRNGWTCLGVLTAATLGDFGWIFWSIQNAARIPRGEVGVGDVATIIAACLTLAVIVVLWCGLFTLQPNESAALLLFGQYKGTTRRAGFSWANPFYTKKKVSLRARNFNTEKLKVNDQRGNPIEIAAVIVWRVHDTAR